MGKSEFRKRLTAGLILVLVGCLYPGAARGLQVTDPFHIFSIRLQDVDIVLVTANKAKIKHGALGLKLATPTLSFPTLGSLPQLSTGWATLALRHDTVTKGGGTVTRTLLNDPNLVVKQKFDWPANKNQVRIRITLKIGSAQNTKTFWRTPHP